MRIPSILIIFTLVACSTTPTPYVPEKKDRGYSDKTIKNDLRVATFQGNSGTKKETAELYAKFRSIEVCNEIGKKYSHILQVKDKTFSKEVTQASSATPSYFYGMSPYYGRSYGMSMNYAPSSVSYSHETYTYPSYEVYFECVDKPMDARVSFSNLSFSQMQTLVKDLQGAVQVEEVLSDSPNIKKLQKADIVVKVGGERVSDIIETYHAARKSNMKNVRVEFFRNGIKKETTVNFLDVTSLVDEAQKEIIKSACKLDRIKDERDICKKI